MYNYQYLQKITSGEKFIGTLDEHEHVTNLQNRTIKTNLKESQFRSLRMKGYIELTLGFIPYSFASMIPPAEMANVASFSGMSGLKKHELYER